MSAIVEAALVLLVLTSLVLLGTSRIASCIRMIAAQGVLLSLLTVAAHPGDSFFRVALLAAGSGFLKGAILPWLLLRALRQAGVRNEVEPYAGYGTSLFLGIVSLAAALWLGSKLALPGSVAPTLAAPVSLFTIFAGLLVIVGRRTALMQVVGYLVLENGIYAFGVLQVGEVPLLVELGVLLDVFVGVFVMGIAIYHISREFDHVDVNRLRRLRG